MEEDTQTNRLLLAFFDSEREIDAYKPGLPPGAEKEAEELSKVEEAEEEEEEEEHCSICLQPLSDRTIIPACSHEFCYECLLVWTEQSRRCPLCSGQVGEYLIHDIRSKYDFSKYYLNPLRTSPRPHPPAAPAAGMQRRAERREVQWGRNERRERERERRAADELDRAIEKRKWIYRHGLYAKHVASNPYTRYKPFPTPAQFALSPDLISRATIFVRRELRVWEALDIEFLTTFTISLMKSIDIRSESAVKLLAEFLDMDTDERTNAEHFAHELYCYLRSPYRDLTRYDAVVQYDTPEHVPAIEYRQRSRRWEEVGRTQSPNTPSSPGPSRLDLGPTTQVPVQQEPLDDVRGKSTSRERGKRPRLWSPDSPDIHHAKLSNHHRLGNIASNQDNVHENIKGKGRAIDSYHGSFDTLHASVLQPEATEATPSVDDSQHQYAERENRLKSVTELNTVQRPVTEDMQTAPSLKQRDRPKVRREALQAMNAHLFDSRGRATSTVAIREHEPTAASRKDAALPALPPRELSIRGAAKTALAPSAPLNPSPQPTHEPDRHQAHAEADSPAHASSTFPPDAMTRTRAQLAMLRAESTLNVTTTPKRGEHDVSSHTVFSHIPGTSHTARDGNHAASTTNSSSGATVSQVYDVSAAQLLRPKTVQYDSDIRDSDAAAVMRTKLLCKLENERKRVQTGEDDPHHHNNSPVPVTEDTQFQALLLPDRIGEAKQLQTKEQLSFGRQDAEMLEKKLRGRAQLRIKLAAAKRNLAGVTAENDQIHSGDRNLMSREEYLRSRLKRVATS